METKMHNAHVMQCVMLKVGESSLFNSSVTNIIAESCDIFGDKKMCKKNLLSCTGQLQ